MRTADHILHWVNQGKVIARCSCNAWTHKSANRNVVREHHADHVQEESDKEHAAQDEVQIMIPASAGGAA